MAREKAHRKYQLTINNPVDKGYTHEQIERLLKSFNSFEYGCLCDEIGEQETPHTHIFVIFKNAVMFSTIQSKFYGAHIEPANGNNQQNRDYIRKEGKWAEDEKKETNLIETFKEFGEMPPDREAGKKLKVEVYEMVKAGASNYEIIEKYPIAMNMLDNIEKVRQMVQNEMQKDTFRDLYVEYIWGDSGVGKTRSVMDKYSYVNVYRVTNYLHPFDGYKGQDVIIFDEFRSSLPLTDMLNYLDGYPIELPCRYADKQACYTKVYIISNIPLGEQYPNIQSYEPKSWEALKRRIHKVTEFKKAGEEVPQWVKEIEEQERRINV